MGVVGWFKQCQYGSFRASPSLNPSTKKRRTTKTGTLVKTRDHAPSLGCVLCILGIPGRDQRLLATNPYPGAGQHQRTKQTADPGPVSRYSSKSEQTHGGVDRVPDVPIWSTSHQASFSRISHHMVAAPAEHYPRPKEQQ